MLCGSFWEPSIIDRGCLKQPQYTLQPDCLDLNTEPTLSFVLFFYYLTSLHISSFICEVGILAWATSQCCCNYWMKLHMWSTCTMAGTCLVLSKFSYFTVTAWSLTFDGLDIFKNVETVPLKKLECWYLYRAKPGYTEGMLFKQNLIVYYHPYKLYQKSSG